jgi:hypothetical protein
MQRCSVDAGHGPSLLYMTNVTLRLLRARPGGGDRWHFGEGAGRVPRSLLVLLRTLATGLAGTE